MNVCVCSSVTVKVLGGFGRNFAEFGKLNSAYRIHLLTVIINDHSQKMDSIRVGFIRSQSKECGVKGTLLRICPLLRAFLLRIPTLSSIALYDTPHGRHMLSEFAVTVTDVF